MATTPAPPPRRERAGVHNVKGTVIFWTEERDALLRARYGQAENAVVAAEIGTTEAGMRGRAKVLGILGRRRAALLWSDGQIATLRRSYGLIPGPMLAVLCGHSPTACGHKARELGLTHKANRDRLAVETVTGTAPDKRDDTIRELRLLLATYIGPMRYLTPMEAAEALGLDEAQLHHRAVRHAAAGAMLLITKEPAGALAH